MFLIGDKVVHPMHGAGIIERITHERLGSRVSSYYVFRMPAGGACAEDPHRCLLPDRPAVSVHGGAHLAKVLSAIPTLEVQMSSNWNQRYRDNLARLKSGDLLEVAWVIKGLMWRDHRRGLSNGERKMLHSAKQILISEVVLVEGTDDYPAVEQRINEAMMLGA